jgi:putative peptide zinc metalloprotease protein
MTLQLRPTFSESWYRVANLRAKLRSSAQITRQFYRGERWYVVRDPAGNQFHRLSDAAYRFVGLLDGSRTVAEAWDLAGGQLADDAPTQPEVIQILSHLYSANLIDSDVTPDSAVLLRRHKKLQQRKMKGRLMNVLFPRIPLWDPDRFLKLWMPLVRVMFSKFGAVFWLAVILGALAMLAPEWDRIKTATQFSIAPGNWLWLWGVFVFVKLIHELGHAFACRRFGGECHELGIMFLVLIPTPYVDASTAWAFPNKWHRMFVGAAGMIVELFFAALCVFVWLYVNPNSLASQLAFNAMLVAGVSTVIFNANPLLRYDGYYILSDYLEIPNLRQKSAEYTLGLIKRHLFRVKAHQPLPPVLQRFWLFTYCVTSSVYRVFVGFAIILLVTYQLPEQLKIIGVLMGLGAVTTFLLVPVFKTFKYLTIEPELHRKRGRATAITLAFATAVVVLVGMVPFWVNIDAVAVVEPSSGMKKHLFSLEDGFVKEIRAQDGQLVRKGDVILVCRNEALEKDIRQAQADLGRIDAEIRRSAAVDRAARGYHEESRKAIQKRLALLRKRHASLTVRAPIDGELVSPQLRDLHGRFIPRNEELAIVQRIEDLDARVVLRQEDVEPVIEQAGKAMTGPEGREKRRVEVRMASDVDTFLPAESVRLVPQAPEYLPSAAPTQAGGGEIATDPRDPSGTKPTERQFEVVVTVANADGRYRPGQQAYVRFRLDKRPLIWQWGRRFWQLIQTNSTGNNA